MIKTRIAGAAAIFTFGVAALGGTFLAVAAPANAEGVGTHSSVADHTPDPFPSQPRDPHTGQGHKGATEVSTHRPNATVNAQPRP